MLTIDVVTIFPEMIRAITAESILKRAIESGKFAINIHDLRRWSPDKKHNKVDDTPYGGGPGMVLMVEPVVTAIEELRKEKSHVVLPSPRGAVFTQAKAEELSLLEHVILICGHYEGMDQRVADNFIDEEISLGTFVLTGGEIPTMAIIDATVRLIPGVLGNSDSLKQESYSKSEDGAMYIEYPQYTKPAVFRDMIVPDVLLSGNHKEIGKWRLDNTKLVPGS